MKRESSLEASAITVFAAILFPSGRMMRIVVDLQACQSGSRLGGIGRYSLALAKAMARVGTEHELFIVLNGLFPLAEFEVRLEFADLIDPANIVSFSAVGPTAEKEPFNAGRRRMSELIREEFIRRLRPDIIHVGSLIEGWGDDVVTSVGRHALAKKTAVTWYDLIPHVQPEMYLTDPALASHYYGKIEEAKKAELLLSISQYSRDEAISRLGLDDHRVVNISGAIDDHFQRIEIPQQKAVELKAAYGINRPFLMYTGSFDARKNQAGLIEAFAQLPPEIRDKYQVVIVGNGWDGIYRDLHAVGRRNGLPSEQVIFTGRVTDEQLLMLYNLCHLFVFPSFQEGLGLPVLEAMACGAPVIGSNCTSVPEVIGWDDALFNPRSSSSITQKIHQALSDEGFRQKLCAHGETQVKKFSWDNSARVALESMVEVAARNSHGTGGWTRPDAAFSAVVDRREYKQLIGSLAGVARAHSVDTTELPSVAYAIEQNELAAGRATKELNNAQDRVGWITPWQTRCGIAMHSEFLINSLPNFKPVVFAEGTPAPNTSDDDNVVRCWQAGDQCDLQEMSKEVRARNIGVLVIQFNFGFFDFPALNRFVLQHVSEGRRIIMVLHSTQDPPARIYSKKLSDLKPALRACDRVLVHTARDVENLSRLSIHNNVTIMPQGVIAYNPTDASARPPAEEFTIATYGFFLPHKGLSEVVEAFGILASEDSNLRLRMVNAEYSPKASAAPIADVRSRISRLGLSNRVTLITDYLTDEESLSHLAQADVVVYPYQFTGESSSAAVRMGLASGKPVAVTPLPIFEDVREAVFQLPGTSIDELAAGLRDLIQRIRSDSDADLATVQRRAQAWRKRHSYRNIGTHLAAIIRNLATHASQAA